MIAALGTTGSEPEQRVSATVNRFRRGEFADLPAGPVFVAGQGTRYGGSTAQRLISTSGLISSRAP